MSQNEIRHQKVAALVQALVDVIEHVIAEPPRAVSVPSPEPQRANVPPNVSAGDEGLWTVREAATFLNVSVSWVYKQSELGTMPTVRLGSIVRFDPRAIRAFAGQAPAATSGRIRRALGPALRVGVPQPLPVIQVRLPSAAPQSQVKVTAPQTTSAGMVLPPDSYLSVKQVAAALGVSTATIYKLCETGRLAHTRNSVWAIKIAPEELKRFKSHKAAPRSQ